MTEQIKKTLIDKSNNIACRIFKEQIELINQLPYEERKTVLYQSIMNSFNQFDNQNENAYVSVSVSVSDSISILGKIILNLLSKNIVCKEFSSNYGGKRIGAGKKPEQIPKQISDEMSNSELSESTSKNIEKEKEKEKEKDNNIKNKYIYLGELKKVNITQDEYDTLKTKYNENDLNEAIEKLDTWLATTPKKIKSSSKYAYFKANNWVWEKSYNFKKEEKGVDYAKF